MQIAENNMPVRPGNVYLAAEAGHHLKVRAGSTLIARLRRGEAVSGHLPSVDVLFESVAREVGAQAVGILLTGMGQDGARGLLAMSNAGAHTIAQDESSCTVFGMPRAAISLGGRARRCPDQPHCAPCAQQGSLTDDRGHERRQPAADRFAGPVQGQRRAARGAVYRARQLRGHLPL
ncbi:CheB methylesterase domain-containing protein [Novosphingobium colocasiae]